MTKTFLKTVICEIIKLSAKGYVRTLSRKVCVFVILRAKDKYRNLA